MKPLIIITGPQAVGKMAVGKALQDLYNYRLFHNHMTIELALDLYGTFDRDTKKLIGEMRRVIFDHVVEKDLDGFVFTYMWAFDMPSEYEYIDDVTRKFEAKGWSVTIVELEADVETRLKRNRTELRLKEKRSKRNVEWSDNDLKNAMDKYRLNSDPGEIKHGSYIRINNTDIEPVDVAKQVYEYIQK